MKALNAEVAASVGNFPRNPAFSHIKSWHGSGSREWEASRNPSRLFISAPHDADNNRQESAE
jgi:hypothetical protein